MLDIGSILFRWLFQCRFCDLLMGSGRDSTPFFVPHTVLIKKSHIADWIFTSHGDGSIKHKFKTHISSSTIFEEFCRRSAVESHHGVVAVFHKASGGSVYLDRPELVAFLNRLREDRKSAAGCGDVSGVLQKFVTPPTQFDECHVVTFDIDSGLTVQSHASKQQLWGTGINVQRRCDLLGGYPEDVLKVATKPRDEKLLLNAGRVIHKFLLQHVVNPEESDTRLVQVQRLVLLFKCDSKGRIHLISCRQLSVVSALEHSPSAPATDAPQAADATTPSPAKLPSFSVDGGRDTVPVYNKMGEHFGVRSHDRQPQQVLEFSEKSGQSPDLARKTLYAQERRLLGVVAEQSGYLAAELSTANLKGRASTRRDPVEEKRLREEQEHQKFLKDRDARKNDWRNLFPRPGIVYSAAKADPDLRNAILGKLMAGDFPGMPSKEQLEEQHQRNDHAPSLLPPPQDTRHHPPQHASPSALHRKSPQKKPRLTRQQPAEANVMMSLDASADAAAPKVDPDAPALIVVDELPPGPPVEAAASFPAIDPGNAQEIEDASLSKATQAPKAKTTAAAAYSRKPQPVRRPLNRALNPAPAPAPAPAAAPAAPAAARTHRSNAPDSARLLRETAYFSTIPGENLTVPKAPLSTGPANFPNSPFGKGSLAGFDGDRKGTVRVVSKNGAIGNVPQKMLA